MREKKPELASFVLIGLVLTSIFAGAVNGADVGGAEEGIDYPIVSNLKAQSADNPLTITLTPVADAAVKSWQPDTNFGSEDVLELSYRAIDEVREAVTLLRFDVASAIPANAIIDSTTLELFLVDGAGADPVGVAAHFVTSNWAESRVTWNSFPTAEPIGIISQVDRSPGSYKSWQVTSFAREWQSGSNNGIYLRGPVDGTYYERTFESREHMERVPRLVVTYHLPSPAYTFTGNVYQGSPPDISTPASGVTVGLWGDEDEWPEAGFERVPLASTTTSDAGEFSLSWEEGDTHYPYLHVIEVDQSGTYSTGAQAGEPGYVKNFNVVSYLDVPLGTYGGIAFWDQMPEEKPDLVITEVWNEDGKIRYQIENIGEAVAPGGHCTALVVDDVYQVEDCVEEDLEPGVDMVRCFEYDWECTHPEDAVTVCADHGGAVEEREEGNNCLERIFECPPEEKPDLVITDLWNEDGTICYQIWNIGDGAAPGGHCTALVVDGVYRVEDCVEEDIAPEAVLTRCFEYGWECTPPEDAVVVCADHRGVVEEREEENNCAEGVFGCPPEEKPDLVITEIECNRENDKIGYRIENIGEAIAPACHNTTLQVKVGEAWVEMCQDHVDVDLVHEESHLGCFEDYTWPECQTIEVRVCADKYNVIDEDNEENNCIEEICDCKKPPVLFGSDVMVDEPVTITSHQVNPAIAVDDQGIVHVAWEDYRDNPELGSIYYSMSTDGGKTFEEDVMVDEPITITSHQVNPAIAVDDQGMVHVAWEDYRDNSELGGIYYSMSTDGGKTFEEDVMVDELITITSHQVNPAIAVDRQGIIHIAWEDYRDNPELGSIYYSMSTDGGKTFEEDVMVDEPITITSHQVNPAIAVDRQGIVHVAWEDYRDDPELGSIYYSRSTDGGEAFSSDVMVDELITITSHQVNPAIAVDRQGIVHVAWEDYRDDPELGSIYYSRSTDGGEAFSSDVMVDEP